MITVTRLNGESLGLNADLIERVEAMPDTVLTLVDGKKLLVRETVEDIIDRVLQYRAAILRIAYSTVPASPSRPTAPRPAHRPPPLRLVSDASDDQTEQL